MAMFAYRGLDVDRSLVSGTLIADTPRQARDVLRERGLTIQEVVAIRTREATSWLVQRRGSRMSPHVVAFTRELSTLLAVGVPLLDAIDSINRHQRKGKRFSRVLMTLHDHVAGGLSLAEAMRQQVGVFDELTVAMTDVGEQSGTLDSVLSHLADYRERARQLRGRIGTALIYPGVVFVTGIGVTLFLMTFVVPNLLETLTDAGRKLPLATQLVKAASDLLLNWWWLLLALVGILVVASAAALVTPGGLRRWHLIQLRLPGLGELVRKQTVARIALVMSVLLRGGLTFVQALQIARNSIRNVLLREALVACEQSVTAGRDLGEAIEQTKAFPPVLAQVFTVGQASGQMDAMLERLATDYDREVTQAAARLTAILEPVMILVLAAMVGLIAFATVLPILEAGNVLK